jgi:hypothetical protein
MGFKVLEISGFHQGVVEVFVLLGSYAAQVDSLLPKFRNSAIVELRFFEDCSYLITSVSQRVNENTK